MTAALGKDITLNEIFELPAPVCVNVKLCEFGIKSTDQKLHRDSEIDAETTLSNTKNGLT